MFKYKTILKLDQNYSKSTNINYSSFNNKFRFTNFTANALRLLCSDKHANSISLIGPFGCGKSSLMVFIEHCLNGNEEAYKILDKDFRALVDKYIFKKRFYFIKIIGETSSIKNMIIDYVFKSTELKFSKRYINSSDNVQISVLIEKLYDDIKNMDFTNIVFLIDECGKFIENSLYNQDKSDLFELQTIAEFVNSKDDCKMLISLHKSLRDYYNVGLKVTHTEWDKIQGRFDNVLFGDNSLEILKIFQHTIKLKTTNIDAMKEFDKFIDDIDASNIFNHISIVENKDSLKKLFPLHPIAVVFIIELFLKFFQNQRTIFSFLFSLEPYGFQDFINKDIDKYYLYCVSDLYDYVNYLLGVYNVSLPDSEIWGLSIDRIKDSSINQVEQDIIKTIALIHGFKLASLILPTKDLIIYSLSSKYEKKVIDSAIKSLIFKNVIMFQNQSRSYSLIEDSNIDLNYEMSNIKNSSVNFSFIEYINQIISNEKLISKKFLITHGLNKPFRYKIIQSADEIIENDAIYIVFNGLKIDDSSHMVINIKNIKELTELGREIYAYKIVKQNNILKLSKDTRIIIDNKLHSLKYSLKQSFYDLLNKSQVYYKGDIYSFKNIQECIRLKIENDYSLTPIINNYTINYTISNGGALTPIKFLFYHMLNYPDKKNLGIEKYPAHMTLYLSIIKPSLMHIKDNLGYKLVAPSGLNFKHIWEFIEQKVREKINAKKLVNYLKLEPFGLNDVKSKLIISLFIIVNKNSISIFKNNEYAFKISDDLLIDLWKNIAQYEIHRIALTKTQEEIFKAYMLAVSYYESRFSNNALTVLSQIVFSKVNMLPDFAKKTNNISDNAKKLRSALFSMKDPVQTYFVEIPRIFSLTDSDTFAKSFKEAFNEIALSFKNMILDIEKHIFSSFYLTHPTYPYKNEMVDIANEILEIESSNKVRAFLNAFIYAENIVDLVDSISVILISKNIKECSDLDIKELKQNITSQAKYILNKTNLRALGKNVKRITILSQDKEVSTIFKDNDENIKEHIKNIEEKFLNKLEKKDKITLLLKILEKEIQDE